MNSEPASCVPPEFSQSYYWVLDTLSVTDGLELGISFEPFPDEEEERGPPNSVTAEKHCRIRFGKVAEWAFVDLMYMRQYFPVHDSPPVLVEMDQANARVYVEEFSIHQEVFGEYLQDTASGPDHREDSGNRQSES